MAFTQISGDALQYIQDNIAAVDSYIKLYAAGTTTPISMATDTSGGTLLVKAKIDSQGRAVNGSDAPFIPHVDQLYRFVLYANATDANNNTFGNALYDIDNIAPFATLVENIADVKNHLTLATATADDLLNLNGGDAINLAERTASNGGGAMWDTETGTGTANGFNRVAHDTLDLTLVLRIDGDLHPKQWGFIDNTDATTILEAINSFLTGNQTIDFGEYTYIISKTGLPVDPFGHRIFDLDDKDDIRFKGERAKFVVSNHNLATNGGLMIFFAKASNGLWFTGLDFDMSFVGINTSSAFYPWGGAIIGSDETNSDAGGVQTQDELNGNWTVDDCTFKMFHTSGQYAQSGTSHGGDPNNGFKIFPLSVFGPFDATTYESQSRKIVIKNCTLKDGHNGYGFWTWAWNDVTLTESTAESFVAKQSSELGVFSGRGEPMMRYHQFSCVGLKVINNHFRAKPCNERTVAGFEGDARFVDYNTNLSGNFGHGNCEIVGNTIIGGRGDTANTQTDWYLNILAYGAITITGNTFGSTSETTNAHGSIGVFWNAESVGGQGNATMAITSNTWSAECDYMDNIVINNGGTTIANRRLKQLVISDNATLGQALYFLVMSGTNTEYGVQDLKVCDNLISGEFNTLFDKNNTNSRAISITSSETTDVLDVSRNIIRDKNIAIITNLVSLTQMTADYNVRVGVTTDWSGAIPLTKERVVGVPAAAAANGSTAERTDGTGDAFYVRQGGAWVAK